MLVELPALLLFSGDLFILICFHLAGVSEEDLVDPNEPQKKPKEIDYQTFLRQLKEKEAEAKVAKTSSKEPSGTNGISHLIPNITPHKLLT